MPKKTRYVVTFNCYGRKGEGRSVMGGKGSSDPKKGHKFKTKRAAQRAVQRYLNKSVRKSASWNPRIQKVKV
jgi:hypothetical protein